MLQQCCVYRYHTLPWWPYNKRTPSSVNRCDDDDPRESRTISFFFFFVYNIRVRSGSEISIWHRWRAEGDPSCMRARTLRVAVGEDNVRAAVAAAGVNTPPTAAAAATAFSLCCSRLFSVARTHVHATNSRPTLTVRTPLPDHGRDLAPPHTLNEPRSTRQTPIFNYSTLNANRVFFLFYFTFCFDLYFYIVYCYYLLYC